MLELRERDDMIRSLREEVDMEREEKRRYRAMYEELRGAILEESRAASLLIRNFQVVDEDLRPTVLRRNSVPAFRETTSSMPYESRLNSPMRTPTLSTVNIMHRTSQLCLHDLSSPLANDSWVSPSTACSPPALESLSVDPSKPAVPKYDDALLPALLGNPSAERSLTDSLQTRRPSTPEAVVFPCLDGRHKEFFGSPIREREITPQSSPFMEIPRSTSPWRSHQVYKSYSSDDGVSEENNLSDGEDEASTTSFQDGMHGYDIGESALQIRDTGEEYENKDTEPEEILEGINDRDTTELVEDFDDLELEDSHIYQQLSVIYEEADEDLTSSLAIFSTSVHIALLVQPILDVHSVASSSTSAAPPEADPTSSPIQTRGADFGDKTTTESDLQISEVIDPEKPQAANQPEPELPSEPTFRLNSSSPTPTPMPTYSSSAPSLIAEATPQPSIKACTNCSRSSPTRWYTRDASLHLCLNCGTSNPSSHPSK